MTPLETRKAKLQEKERWKAIPSTNGRFEASNLGRIRSLFDNRNQRKVPTILKHTLNRGYAQVSVRVKGKTVTRKIHRLVLEAFVGPCPKGLQCGHLNGDRADNRLPNLKWLSPKENTAHKKHHGTSQEGESHAMAKLSEKQVLEIREKYKKLTGCISNAKELAKEYGVRPDYIRAIACGRYWKHLPYRKTGYPKPKSPFINFCVRLDPKIIKTLRANGILISEVCREALQDALTSLATPMEGKK